MESKSRLSFMSSGSSVFMKSSNLYLTSNGFYPETLTLESKLNMENMLFKILAVQIDNSQITYSNNELIQFKKEIVIQHQKSGKYISATYFQENWVISLQSTLSLSCLLNLQPCFKSQITSLNSVQYQDELQIMLSIQNDKNPEEVHPDYYLGFESSKLESGLVALPTIATQFQFEKISLSDQGLCYGSFVKIKQIEKNAYLYLSTSDNFTNHKNRENTNKMIFYKQYFSAKLIPYWKSKSSISILQNYDIWRIYHPEKQGQQIQNQARFYLQNYSGDFFLQQCQIVKNIEGASQYQIDELVENQHQFVGRILLEEQSLTFESINSPEIQKDNCNISYQQEGIKSDLLQIEICQNIGIIQYNWLSCIENIVFSLISFIKKHKSIIISQIKGEQQNCQELDYLLQKLKYCELALIDLIKFCIVDGQLISQIDKNILQYSKANTKNQNLIRNKLIIQYLVKFLTAINLDNELEKMSQNLISEFENETQQIILFLQFQKIIKLAFIFFEAFCLNNYENGLLIFIAYYKLQYFLGQDVGAFHCLQRIFATNQNLIPLACQLLVGVQVDDANMTIVQLIFKKALALKKQVYMLNILKWFSILSEQNNIACRYNQNYIAILIRNSPNFLITLYPKGDRLLYIETNGRFIEINELYKKSDRFQIEESLELQSDKKFIDEQLNLISLLCKGKNAENITIYSKSIPSSHLLSYINGEQIDETLQSRILSILINLYINCHPFYQKPQPKLIFNYQKIISKQDRSQFSQNDKQSIFKFDGQDVLLIDNLLEIIRNILQTTIFVQGRVNLSLSLSLSQTLKLLNQICIIKFKKLESSKNQFLVESFFHILIEAFSKLPEAIEKTQPSREYVQEYEQFQQKREIFNEIANQFFDYFLHFSQLSNQKLLFSSIQNSEQLKYIKLDFGQPVKYQQIAEILLLFINHSQLSFEMQLKAFILFEKLLTTKKSILISLKHCLFLETPEQIQAYSDIRYIYYMLQQQETAHNTRKQFQDSISLLNNLIKMLGFSHNLIFIQRILINMNFDRLLLFLLQNYQQTCKNLTEKLNKANIDREYQFKWKSEENLIIEFCQGIFSILRLCCIRNQQYKIRILSQLSKFESYLNYLNLGQFDLLKTIYLDSFQLINSVSHKLIYLLFENLTVWKFETLTCLLCQQGIICTKNLISILEQIKLNKQLFQLLGFDRNSFNSTLKKNQYSFEGVEKLGQLPYLFQISAITFLLQLIQCITPEQKRILQECFPSSSILDCILQLVDIYQIQIGNISIDPNIIILNTVLRMKLLKLLNSLICIKDISQCVGDQQELMGLFLAKEKQIFKNIILTLDYQQWLENKHSDEKVNIITKYFQIFEQNMTDQFIGVKNPFQQASAKIVLQQHYDCFQYTNYGLLIFDLSLNLLSLIQEQIDNLGESSSKSKSSRASSSLAFKQKTASINIIDISSLEDSINPYINLKNEVNVLLQAVEQSVFSKISQVEIQENSEFLIEKSEQLKILCSRQLSIPNFNVSMVQRKKKDIIDSYFQPLNMHDNRIHQLIELSIKTNSTLIAKQIATLTGDSKSIVEETFQMFSFIYKQFNLIDANFEIQMDNFELIIQPLIACLRQSFVEINSCSKSSISILRFLQQLLDVHTYIRQDFNASLAMYLKNKNGKFTLSEQILQQQKTKQLQIMIINQGFFDIFITFCEQYHTLDIDQCTELNFVSEKIKKKIFYNLLLTATKLIKGTEQANSFAQQRLIDMMVKNRNNSLLQLLSFNFQNQFEIDDKEKTRLACYQEIKRIKLIYETNQSHLFDLQASSTLDLKKSLILVQINFIQLLAEDHFRAFQDFFREQIGFSQTFDILHQLENVLLKFFSQETFQPFSEDEFILIINTFDCIKELIQGPCPQNQVKICQTPFLRLCYKILNFDDSQQRFINMYPSFKKNQEKTENRTRGQTLNEIMNKNVIQAKQQVQQQFIEFYKECPGYCEKLLLSFQKGSRLNYRLYMLSEIKYRCSSTLESLTDDESTLNQTLGKISSIINEKLLIRNITTQYVKFKILHSSGKNYTNKVFSHLLEEKKKFSEKSSETTKIEQVNWSLEETVTLERVVKDFCDSFIIETGYSLFNILAQIYQFKNQDILERIYEQIDQSKSKKQSYRALLLYNLYQSFFSLQQFTEKLTGNLLNNRQQQSLGDKIFTVFSLEKAEEDTNVDDRKIGYRALRFYATRTGSIEVILPSRAIKKVMFPLVPHCLALSEPIKTKFILDIDLTSQQAKLQSILINSNKTIEKLKSEYQFQANYKRYIIVNLVASNQEVWKQIIFYVIVLQNFMIILTSNGQYDPILDSILLSFNILQIVLQFVCFFIFLIRKLPYLKIKSQEIVYQKMVNRIRKREIKYKYLDQQSSVVQQEYFILERADSFLLEQNKFLKFYYSITDQLVLYRYIFLDYEMIYFLMFTTIATLGLFYKTILALLLLDLFWRFPMLTAIIHSVWRPIISIILLLASFFILQYYYSLVVYDFYSEDINYSPYCKNFQQCFSFILDVTFKKDSGAPGYVAINGSVYEDSGYRYGLANFWEFCYYFFVISLVYSIFTGLILDSFGTDREEAQEWETAVKEYCLVCGIDKGIIEKKARHKKGFRFHIKYEHSVWNYIFFISYLQGKKRSDYNGIESYVDSELKKESISWLPINQALSIPQQIEDNIEEQIGDKLSKISQLIEKKRLQRKK